jgi:Fe-Mn family superoxide dismutase
MEIHHGKHHAAYVNNLNKAVEATPALQGKSLEELLLLVPTLTDPRLQNTVRNNGGGDWNHTFFWEIMSPASESGQPSAELKAAIETSFGSLEKMQEALNQAALGQFGSGWAWLIKKDGKLAIVATPNQDNPLMKGTVPEEKLGIPLLGVDVWEHAYYLNYQNRRADYLKAWWNVVNWKAVSDRFAA